MISMTGYGYKEIQDETATITIELKSLNSRYLDICLNIPSFLSSYEMELRQLLASHIQRGKVELSIGYITKNGTTKYELSENTLAQYLSILKRIKKEAKIGGAIKLSHLLTCDSLITQTKSNSFEPQKFFSLIQSHLKDVIDEFNRYKEKEGSLTKQDIFLKLSAINTSIKKIESYSQTIEDRIKNNLIVRFKELLEEQVDMQRVYSEVAVALAKSTINEEIQRLKGHIAQFELIVEKNSEVKQMMGKSLDFLVQEMNREINTIGSKNFIQELTYEVVLVKDNLEQIREQLRNIQ